MTTNKIPVNHNFPLVCSLVGLKDSEIAEMLKHGIATVQEGMDAALFAGLDVKPSFTLIENRLTPWGMRVDSFVCNVSSFRRLA